jgi:uncharacterized protein YpmB
MNAKSLIWNKFTLILVLIALGAGGYVYWGSSQKHSLASSQANQRLQPQTGCSSSSRSINPMQPG